MGSKLLIFGVGDFPEVLYCSILFNYKKCPCDVLGFVVDDAYYQDDTFCDKTVYRYSELSKEFPDKHDVEILVAIGYSDMNQNRARIFERLRRDEWKIASYIDPNAIVRIDEEDFGEGNIVLDGANIGIGCKIGDGNIFFSGSTLAHHGKVGNFNFFALRASVAGRVEIGNYCFLGNNSCTKDHITIADQTLVGAGCYLSHSVAPPPEGVRSDEVHRTPKEKQSDDNLNRRHLRIAILVSAGGSIFRKALEILQECDSDIDFVMISDRPCKAEQIASDYDLPLRRIEGKSKQDFSLACKEYLDTFEHIDAVMTFVTRLITKELIDAYPCVNIHPALLPAFKGFRAVDQAYEAKVKFFGSTLHMADAEMDHGPIIAQMQMPVYSGMPREQMLEASFLQDVYLTLLLIDLLATGRLSVYPSARFEIQNGLPYSAQCNPCMDKSSYLEKLEQLQRARKLKVF